MPAKDKVKQKKAAREQIKKILSSHNLKIEKVTRQWPRFFVAICAKNNKRYVFKTCLFARSIDRDTNIKFLREIMFLNWLSKTKLHFLRAATTKIHCFGLSPRAWYIRDYIQNQSQNIKSGNARFKSTFFTDKTINWLIDFRQQMQKIKLTDLPPSLTKLFYSPSLVKIIFFINLNKNLIAKVIGRKEYQSLIAFLKSNQRVYNSAPCYLSHNELYASHFFKKKGGGFIVIDWENLCPTNPVRDLAAVWMRAYAHREWQEKFLNQWRKTWSKPTAFDKLFALEIILQSLGNISEINFVKNQADFAPLANFSRHCVKRFLQGEKMF